MAKTVKLSIREYEKLKIEKAKEFPAFLKEAKTFANKFLMENFNMRLEIPIKMNGRLSSTLGRYMSRTYFGEFMPVSIELSKTHLTAALIVGDVEEVYDTLKHELVHYALSVQGKNFNDGSYDFEMKLYELNISSSGKTPASKKFTKRTMKLYKPYKIYKGANNEEFTFTSGKSYYASASVKNKQQGVYYRGSLTHVGYEIKELTT